MTEVLTDEVADKLTEEVSEELCTEDSTELPSETTEAALEVSGCDGWLGVLPLP